MIHLSRHNFEGHLNHKIDMVVLCKLAKALTFSRFNNSKSLLNQRCSQSKRQVGQQVKQNQPIFTSYELVLDPVLQVPIEMLHELRLRSTPQFKHPTVWGLFLRYNLKKSKKTCMIFDICWISAYMFTWFRPSSVRLLSSAIDWKTVEILLRLPWQW